MCVCARVRACVCVCRGGDSVERGTIWSVAVIMSYSYTLQRLDLMSTRQTDGTSVKVTISLVDAIKNHDVVQLMNVIFKRILRALKLQRIGRDYYDANAPLEVPQHKYVHVCGVHV